jgi:hypothetical protein
MVPPRPDRFGDAGLAGWAAIGSNQRSGVGGTDGGTHEGSGWGEWGPGGVGGVGGVADWFMVTAWHGRIQPQSLGR